MCGEDKSKLGLKIYMGHFHWFGGGSLTSGSHALVSRSILARATSFSAWNKRLFRVLLAREGASEGGSIGGGYSGGSLGVWQYPCLARAMRAFLASDSKFG